MGKDRIPKVDPKAAKKAAKEVETPTPQTVAGKKPGNEKQGKHKK